MSKVKYLPTNTKIDKNPPLRNNFGGGNGGPPIEQLLQRVTNVETMIPYLATKEDLTRECGSLRSELHAEVGKLRGDIGKDIQNQTWRFITWSTGVASALVAAAFFFAKIITNITP